MHVLTLTATPIPRTLNMALGGLRELSIITTPPADRVAIQTIVAEWNDATLREAVLRELRAAARSISCTTRSRPSKRSPASSRTLVPEARSASATARCASAIWNR